MRTGTFSYIWVLLILLFSTSGAVAAEQPTYEITASGSSVSLKQAKQDIFHLFSERYQKKYGKMSVLSSTTTYTKVSGVKVSLIKAHVHMERSRNPEWVVFAVWPIKHQKYQGNVFVFNNFLNHKKYLIKKVRDILANQK